MTVRGAVAHSLCACMNSTRHVILRFMQARRLLAKNKRRAFPLWGYDSRLFSQKKYVCENPSYPVLLGLAQGLLSGAIAF